MGRLFEWLTYSRSLIALVVLNIVDATSTHWALKLGFAEEVNPIMRWAWSVSPDLFWILKMGLVAIGILILGAFASEKVARKSLVVACLVYVLVILVHAYGWATWLLS